MIMPFIRKYNSGMLFVMGCCLTLWVIWDWNSIVLLNNEKSLKYITRRKTIEYASFGPIESETTVIFSRGQHGYNTSRIPALVYHNDYFLAFCEARKDTHRDIGNMDIILRRGKRKGWKVEWSDAKTVVSMPGMRTMNPVPIVDKELDMLLMVFIAIPSHISQWKLMRDGLYQQAVLVTRSFDNGETWTAPQDITDSTLAAIRPLPALYAPGPGHGIKLKSGRLMVPGNYFVKDHIGMHLVDLDNFSNTTNYANVIYSDDFGDNWQTGGKIPFSQEPKSGYPIHTNEATVVELDNGTVMLNTRTLNALLPRIQSYSVDGGLTFSYPKIKQELIEPGFKIVDDFYTIPSKAAGCQGSVIAFPSPDPNHPRKRWLLFSNPASRKFRDYMTVKLSLDGGETWSPGWMVYNLKSSYSDLTYFEDTDPFTGKMTQNFAILFEGGLEQPHESILFKTFNLDAFYRGQEFSQKFEPIRKSDSLEDYELIRVKRPEDFEPIRVKGANNFEPIGAKGPDDFEAILANKPGDFEQLKVDNLNNLEKEDALTL
ncbi:sialidase-2-like [Antedon mediterranea]|uniref:sialidase-2-like n=1 Tax=Antedon mediterranea TaxID=105859 RepID=UPI003AF7205B